MALTGAAIVGMGGCATPLKLADCPQGERPADVAQLFFGRNVADRPGVSGIL